MVKTKNIAIAVDGHKFKFQPHTTSKYCESCGVGYAAYLNLKPKCRNFIDVRMLMYRLVDSYLDAGGDPEMVIISKKDLANLMEKK
jgi:hypothetical protein